SPKPITCRRGPAISPTSTVILEVPISTAPTMRDLEKAMADGTGARSVREREERKGVRTGQSLKKACGCEAGDSAAADAVDAAAMPRAGRVGAAAPEEVERGDAEGAFRRAGAASSIDSAGAKATGTWRPPTARLMERTGGARPPPRARNSSRM